MKNPEIIDALERYCQVTQTNAERQYEPIILEPTNRYTKKTLYLPFVELKEYLYTKLLSIKDTHEISYSYGASLLECLYEQ